MSWVSPWDRTDIRRQSRSLWSSLATKENVKHFPFTWTANSWFWFLDWTIFYAKLTFFNFVTNFLESQVIMNRYIKSKFCQSIFQIHFVTLSPMSSSQFQVWMEGLSVILIHWQFIFVYLYFSLKIVKTIVLKTYLMIENNGSSSFEVIHVVNFRIFLDRHYSFGGGSWTSTPETRTNRFLRTQTQVICICNISHTQYPCNLMRI